MEKKAVIKIDNLVKHFPIRAGVFKRIVGWVKAVDGVSFEVYEGETLGLVGESGCGKTTVGMTLLRLYEPTSGRIIFNDEDTTHYFMNYLKARSYVKRTYIDRFEQLKIDKGAKALDELEGVDRKYYKIFMENGAAGLHKYLLSNLEEKRKQFRQNVQIVFQDPYSSLDPRMRIKNIVAEGVLAHKLVEKSKINDFVGKTLEDVGIISAYMFRFPHEFSGGQRQRIGMARALAMQPKVVIADEAVAALDVSIRSQIINLMEELQDKHRLTYIFISHDLAVVKHISDRVAVMYLGKMVEMASKKELFEDPLHPYTVSLMSAIPIPDPAKKRKKRIILKGDVPSPINPPSGCRFHTRCPVAKPICKEKEPPLVEVKPGHFVACHFPGSLKWKA
ncbi:MAG: ABC transporter ATP-binding protein [Thermotogaceae bacterium]|nr:ABC transporter ATP-binding protein [Thermotogaceae bacterium]